VSSLQILPSFGGISSFWQLQKPCRSLQVTRICGLANGVYFVFQLINKVPQPHCALGHHYYSPVGGLSRIWIRNFTWIVGERSKEDKILSLSLKALQTFPTVYRVPPPIALCLLISIPHPPPQGIIEFSVKSGKHSTRTLSLVQTCVRFKKKNLPKSTVAFNRGETQKCTIVLGVVKWVSSCFDHLFPYSWAPPLLLHIFSLLLPVQLLNYLKPGALNAEFQHFIPRFNKISLLCRSYSRV